MEPIRLWAAVSFTAQNGGTDALLSRAAAAGLHIYDISARPGGFQAHCAAWHYLPLAALARKQRVRLRIQARQGLFFRLRPLLHRPGLWLGTLLFVPLLLWSQSLVWAVDYGALTRGQQARAAAILWENALQPGAVVTETKLSAGEYALLESGEFSWASLNFSKGRLAVEAAAATPKPDIAAGTLHGIRARCGGTVTDTNLTSGTMLVVPGQQVEQGQGLIGTARSERDGTLIFAPAAGTVRAQFEWSDQQDVPLREDCLQLTGQSRFFLRIFFKNKYHSLFRSISMQSSSALQHVLHHQLGFFGLFFPVSVEETVAYEQSIQPVLRTEQQALDLARLHSLQTLFQSFPDAQLLARKEDIAAADSVLAYRVTFTIIADICEKSNPGS